MCPNKLINKPVASNSLKYSIRKCVENYKTSLCLALDLFEQSNCIDWIILFLGGYHSKGLERRLFLHFLDNLADGLGFLTLQDKYKIRTLSYKCI
jgi:hypothetical protein